MTSEERHEKRYQRRKAAREKKRREMLAQYDDFNVVASTGALIQAHLESRRGVLWKASVARYEANMLKYSGMQSKDLYAGNFKCKGYYFFVIIERGKVREIHSLHYSDRVVRRSACTNALVPILSHNLIYDNGASLKGKGVSFSANRCETHLHEHYRNTGSNDGYIVIVDFKNYFGNIPHDKLFIIIDKYIHDARLNGLAKSFVESSNAYKSAAEKGRGLFIGPEDSQIFAIAFPNAIDHLIKDQWRQRYYNRYMDDSYIIFKTKEEAREYLQLLIAEYEKWGIVVNPRKTQIVKLSHGFTFLKTKYYLTETGKVIKKPDHKAIVRERRKLKKKPDHKAIVRERRKLKKQKHLYDAGEMTLEQVSQSYMSWRGSMKSRNAYRSIHSMDKLFYALFGTTPWKDKKSKKRGK